MTRTNQVRLHVELLEDRTVPSAVAFTAPPALAHLGAIQFHPSDPYRCRRCLP